MKASILVILLAVPSLVRAQSVQGQWQRVAIDSFFEVQQVVFVDSEVGYVLGGLSRNYSTNEVIFRTSDGGTAWHEIDLKNLPAGDTSGLLPVNGESKLCAPTRNALFLDFVDMYSFDSGASWARRSYPTSTGNVSPGNAFWHWYMYSASSGYGQDVIQSVLKTEDSAKTWCCQLRYYAQDIYWADSLHGMAMLTDTVDNQGVDHQISGFYTWGTTDGGQNWTFHFTALPNVPRWLGASTDPISKAIWLYPNYFTTDEGATWQIDSTPANTLQGSVIGNAQWISIKSGPNQRDPAEWLAVSYDAGLHWKIDSTSANGLSIVGTTFTDARHGWAVGNDTVTAGRLFGMDSTVGYVLKYIGPPLALGVSSMVLPVPPALELSPNPAANTLHFELGASEPIVRCDAVNILGGTIECPLTSLHGSQGDVDISSLAPGMYELRLWTRAECVSKPFVKAP